MGSVHWGGPGEFRVVWLETKQHVAGFAPLTASSHPVQNDMIKLFSFQDSPGQCLPIWVVKYPGVTYS